MILRQAAFETPGTFLKGALHCHTTLSDGNGSPASTVRHHGHMGYDFLAITDHRRYNFTNFAPDSGVLSQPGMTAGQIKIRDCCTDYIRMEVVDSQGRRAWTNPIFF